MMPDAALKRWLVLAGLLLGTLYLVWQSPDAEAPDQVNPVAGERLAAARMADHIARNKPIGKPIDEFHLPVRVNVAEEIVDLFAPAIEPKRHGDGSGSVRAVLPPQAPPPLPFTFVGKVIEGDGVKIFLQEDDVLHVLKLGETIGQRYKLVAVEEDKLSLLYLPMNTIQTMIYGEKH